LRLLLEQLEWAWSLRRRLPGGMRRPRNLGPHSFAFGRSLGHGEMLDTLGLSRHGAVPALDWDDVGAQRIIFIIRLVTKADASGASRPFGRVGRFRQRSPLVTEARASRAVHSGVRLAIERRRRAPA